MKYRSVGKINVLDNSYIYPGALMLTDVIRMSIKQGVAPDMGSPLNYDHDGRMEDNDNDPSTWKVDPYSDITTDPFSLSEDLHHKMENNFYEQIPPDAKVNNNNDAEPAPEPVRSSEEKGA